MFSNIFNISDHLHLSIAHRSVKTFPKPYLKLNSYTKEWKKYEPPDYTWIEWI